MYGYSEFGYSGDQAEFKPENRNEENTLEETLEEETLEE